MMVKNRQNTHKKYWMKEIFGNNEILAEIRRKGESISKLNKSFTVKWSVFSSLLYFSSANDQYFEHF